MQHPDATNERIGAGAVESDARLPPPCAAGVAAGAALFLDVDGTLLDFADVPHDVVVAPELAGLLVELRRGLGGALALISGRPLATIDAFFAPHVFPAAGLHGLELRDADRRITRLTADVQAMQALRAGMRKIAEDYPALLVEDKEGSLALHYRRAPLLATIAVEEAKRLAARLGTAFVLQTGDHVVEIRPAGSDKGRAVRALMSAPPFAGRRPVAIGDDLTDEDAFAAAQALGGAGVIVGSRRPTRAWHALAGPAQVRRWLADLLAQLRKEASREFA